MWIFSLQTEESTVDSHQIFGNVAEIHKHGFSSGFIVGMCHLPWEIFTNGCLPKYGLLLHKQRKVRLIVVKSSKMWWRYISMALTSGFIVGVRHISREIVTEFTGSNIWGEAVWRAVLLCPLKFITRPKFCFSSHASLTGAISSIFFCHVRNFKPLFLVCHWTCARSITRISKCLSCESNLLASSSISSLEVDHKELLSQFIESPIF